MADIDPYAQLAVTQLTPRSPNLVDQVSEARRVTEAIMRANPLYNARVDGGLMVWRGNYAGGGGITDSYLWIGEVTPRDLNLNKPQRGMFITRDDPNHARVLWVYDASPVAGEPLRQTLTMHDADDRPLLREGNSGGTEWPFASIIMYPANTKSQVLKNDAGASEAFPILGAENSVINSGYETAWHGFGPMVGPILKFYGLIVTTSGGPTIEARYIVRWNDAENTTWTSPVVSVGPFVAFNHFLILNTKEALGKNLVGYECQIEWQGRVASGSYKWSYFYPKTYVSYG